MEPPAPEWTSIVNTSLQRTYRNLRLGIAGTVVLIAISVGVAAGQVGLLPSISAYYYTSARNVFVGALIAAAVAIIAISGRGLQRLVLDAAGLFAPIVALVPTPIRSGSVPGYERACPTDASCVPIEALPDIETGVITYLIVGGLAVAVGVVVTVFPRESPVVSRLPAFVVATVVLGSVLLAWLYARDAFVHNAHLVAAVMFFGLIAVAAVANAFSRPDNGEEPGWGRVAYWVVAIAMIGDIIVSVAARFGNVGGSSPPPLLVGELIALLLFVVFWVVQSSETWDDTDPAIRPVSARVRQQL